MVMLRQALDDLPLYLTDDMDEATQFAMRVDWDWDGRTEEGLVLNLGGSRPVGISLYTFKDGFVVESKMLRVYEEENPTEDEEHPDADV